MPTQCELPTSTGRLIGLWKAYSRFWGTLHYILGVTGMVSAINIASRPSWVVQSPLGLELSAYVAAITMVAMTFLVPPKQARTHVAAWRVLGDAVRRYQTDSTFTEQQLCDATAASEGVIGHADPQ